MNLRSTHYSLEMKLPDSSEQTQPAWHRNGECCVIQEARPVWHLRSLTSKEDAVATSNQLQSYQIFLLFIWSLVMGFISRNIESKGWWKDNDQGLHWKSFRGKFTTGREGGELTWLGDRGCHRGISSYAARSRRGPSPPFPWGSIRTTCMWCDSRIRRGGNLSNKPKCEGLSEQAITIRKVLWVNRQDEDPFAQVLAAEVVRVRHHRAHGHGSHHHRYHASRRKFSQ